MNYRAVKSNESNLCLAIGIDENQANADYNGIGTWCNFTFSEIPQIAGQDCHHEIIDNTIVAVLNT